MFYKIDNKHIVSAIAVSAPGYVLTEENHTEYTYPMGGWYWFGNASDALVGLNISTNSVTALQGMLAIHAAGLTAAFVSWKKSLDPITDSEIIAFLDKAGCLERNSPIVQAMTSGLRLTDEDVDDLFISAATF